MEHFNNKRRHERFRANREVRVGRPNAPGRDVAAARMVSISEGGVCFISGRFFAPQESVRIEFENCQVIAEVRHCRMREYSATTEFVTGGEVQSVLEGSDTWESLLKAAT